MTTDCANAERTKNGSPERDSFAPDALKRLREGGDLDMAALLPVRQYLAARRGDCPCELYEQLGNRILRLGEPLLAYDVLANGLEHWPDNVRLRQLLGLALARSGATGRANGMLQQLYAEGERDAETLGILARTHKDLWEQAAGQGGQDEHLRKAHETYAEAYRLAANDGRIDDAVYTGINAASTAAPMGEGEIAREIAGDIREKCRLKLQDGDDYWAAATMGEAAVILGEPEEAETWYRRASDIGRGHYGDLNSTRRNARLLAKCLCGDEQRFDPCFNIPTILVFSGRPGMDARHFSAFPTDADEAEARSRLENAMDVYADKIGYSGAMSGADILFLETVLGQGGEINVVLPVAPEEFGASIADSRWRERFDAVTGRAARVVAAGEHRVSSSLVAREYTSGMLEGMARLRARMLDTEVVAVAVDESHAEGIGVCAPEESEDMSEFPQKISTLGVSP